MMLYQLINLLKLKQWDRGKVRKDCRRIEAKGKILGRGDRYFISGGWGR
jgi:hypothetical protein